MKQNHLVYSFESGNVAEWGTMNNKARVFGGTADMPVDAKIRTRQPAPEYVGFRVVKKIRRQNKKTQENRKPKKVCRRHSFDFTTFDVTFCPLKGFYDSNFYI